MEIKKLTVKDVSIYNHTLIRFIFESMSNGEYMKSYTMEDAENKCEELYDYLSHENAIVYGAIISHRLVGFIWAYQYSFRDDKNRVYVSILHVDKEFRNQKIGYFLLNSVEIETKTQKLGSIFLHAEAINEGAIRFYKKMGYELERVQLVKECTETLESVEIVGGVQILNSLVTKKNVENLAKLFLLNTEAHILTQGYDYQWACRKIDELVRYIDEGKAIVVGYLSANKIIGFAWAFPYLYCKEERYMLNAIVVLPEYRKQHIASQLLRTIESQVRSKRKKLYTFVDAINTPAYRFYLKHGMEEENYQLVKRLSYKCILRS